MKPLWLSFSLWLILFAASAQKAPLAPNGGALVVGISHYKELDSLQFAHRDAAAFAEFLKTQHVPDDNIKLFLNEEATRFNIVDELYNLTQKLNKGDKFFFYFTGHGDLEAKIGYENSLLLLHGCYKKNYFQGTEYLQLSELRTWFGELTKKGVEVIFIADACHSGGLIGGKEGLTKTQKALQESWQGITKILSSQANEFSLEGKQWGGGRGIFSYFLVNGLTGRADANKDKKVSLKELDNYLKTNVVREANPNTQTPVIQGNAKQMLSQSSEAGLKKLADAERLSFPIITEANLKAADPMTMIGGLDKTLVETYNKLTKALAEKRLNTFDNEKDYALLHYRKLVAEKVPEHLLAIIKRNLGAALAERERMIMSNLRETGNTVFIRAEKIISPAISNLKEAMNLLGVKHQLYPFLQARVLVLEGEMAPAKPTIEAKSGDEIDHISVTSPSNIRQVWTRKEREILDKRKKMLLLKSLQFEPNMISTYVLLASAYRTNNQPDSAIYYQEKITELLPNEGFTFKNLGSYYDGLKYTNAKGQPIPHPKAIANYEKAVEVFERDIKRNRTAHKAYIQTYERLGFLYQGEDADAPYHDYNQAIRCYEKLVTLYETTQELIFTPQELVLMKELKKHLAFSSTSNQATRIVQEHFTTLMQRYAMLYKMYQTIGNNEKAIAYMDTLLQKTENIGTVFSYKVVTARMTNLFRWDKSKAYLDKAIHYQTLALQKAESDLANSIPREKAFLELIYQEQLKGMGVLHRALQNYDEAEKYLLKAINYPIPDTYFGKVKAIGVSTYTYQNRIIMLPRSGVVAVNGEFQYYLDANLEMFFLKCEQNKFDDAFIWIDQSFQTDEMGIISLSQSFETSVFNAYPTLDQARFKALKAKYFPPTEKK
jgi:tetratricopeptide (TPR) repeat protein